MHLDYENKIESLSAQLDSKMELDQLASFLNDCLALFSELSVYVKNNFNMKFAKAFALDDILSSEENFGSKVELIDDVELNKEVLFAITKFKKEKYQHPKRTYRLPGVVFCDRENIRLVEMLNSLKCLIQDAICSNSNVGTRQRGAFIHDYVSSNIMLKELYRTVTVLNRPVKSVSFTWAAKVPQSCYVEKRALLESLESEFLNDEKGMGVHIKEEIQLVKSFPEGKKIRKLRPVPPHPRVNIVFDNDLKERKMFHANLPIFIESNDDSYASCKIKILRDFVNTEREKRSNTLKNFKLQIERLNLYLEVN